MNHSNKNPWITVTRKKTPVPEPEFKQPYIDWIFGLRNENEAKEKKAAIYQL
jgi:hypothetical protein